MPKISIIVPVYNTERYLEMCVDSIRSQTLREIEIILVDDGSTDSSASICRGFQAKDDRIKFFSIPSSGPAVARNVGLENATGEYIGFVDSDDWIDQNMFERLYQTSRETKADIVGCNFVREYLGRRTREDVTWKTGFYTRKDIEDKIFPELIASEALRWIGPFNLVTKIFRRQLIEEKRIRFNEELLSGEDWVFSKTCMLYSRSLYLMGNAYWYHYRYNMSSITNTYLPKSWDIYKAENAYWTEILSNYGEYDFSQQLQWHRLAGALTSLNYETKPGNPKGFVGRYITIKQICEDLEKMACFNLGKLPRVDFRRRTVLWCLENKWVLLLVLLGWINTLAMGWRACARNTDKQSRVLS